MIGIGKTFGAAMYTHGAGVRHVTVEDGAGCRAGRMGDSKFKVSFRLVCLEQYAQLRATRHA